MEMRPSHDLHTERSPAMWRVERKQRTKETCAARPLRATAIKGKGAAGSSQSDEISPGDGVRRAGAAVSRFSGQATLVRVRTAILRGTPDRGGAEAKAQRVGHVHPRAERGTTRLIQQARAPAGRSPAPAADGLRSAAVTMARRPNGVVLMGPPGCGKSFLGNHLARLGIVTFVELEPILVEKFGKGAAFQANKDAALKFIRESCLRQLRVAKGPIAFESTGVSDRALIEELVGGHQVLLVKVETPKVVCLERLATRPRARNLSNDLAAGARFYDFWHRDIEPTYAFAATVDGTSVSEATRAIVAMLNITRNGA